jgi:C4-dicarboxylate transporter DctM subunit
LAAALLLLGMPISVLLAAVTALVLLIYTHTPLTILVQQLFNALDNSVLLAIPFFILAGGIMTEGALARRLIDVMNLAVGRFRGGAAMATVTACVFFAALSGSSPATVVAIGSIMYPALVKAGYDDKFTTGLITSAGSLGIVIPPSIPMILYCLVMNVSVAKLFMAGILPGILIGGALLLYTYVLARRHNWRSEKTYSRAEARKVILEGLPGLFLPVIVLGGIYTGLFTPTEAAAVSVVYALGVEFLIHKELTFARLFRVCREAAVLSSCLLFILACAMTFVWLLTA